MATSRKTKSKPVPATETGTYTHPEAKSLLRPEVGTQAQFKKKKPPASYRYDSSLAPALDWDGKNWAREAGQWLIARIEDASKLAPPHRFAQAQELRDARGQVVLRVASLRDAVNELKRLERPFLNWAGKAERLSFDVPTLPLFVHERLATQAILETLKGHRRDKQLTFADLYADPQHPVADQVLKAYEHQDKWTNRMVLGDSLVVMNSLLKYEGLGGQVQMIYIDPPYGVKFGSNFQPFVRKRDVKHNDDEDMSREPEMVKAYRDTWELGLHSYLTYLRDRLLLARELLTASGSVFVQISDENLHHVRELMDEVFGDEQFSAQVAFKAADPLGQSGLARVYDYILWYARDSNLLRYHPLFRPRDITGDREYKYIDDAANPDGYRILREAELDGLDRYFGVFRRRNLTSSGFTESCTFSFQLGDKTFSPAGGKSWSTNAVGIEKLKLAGRLFVLGKDPYFKSYQTDFPWQQYENCWTDKPPARAKPYVVDTAEKFIQRCLLMTTDPGDLVLDPTCGSGTTAYVAEQWGRRWITIDTSRVPLALARQRLLTATFPYYDLKDDARGPAGGFIYKRKQNNRGEEVGGIVPHVTLKSIANDEPPAEEVLVDRPEQANKITRVTGPFVVEATIPTPVDWDTDGQTDTGESASTEHTTFVERMLEVLRRSPNVQLGGNKSVTFTNVRPPAKTMSLSAEAVLAGGGKAGDQTVAIVFGPENGAVAEKLVWEASKEAHAKSYQHLYVIGFAIQANARKLVDQCDQVIGIPATYVQATPDLMMGDLLKNLRSSQLFSVCGLPEIALRRAKADDVKKLGGDAKGDNAKDWYQVELLGLDVFDPSEQTLDHRAGHDVPCWMVDGDYNGLVFKATQVFFPRTAAWDDIKRALKGQYDDGVWSHLAGTVSAPFKSGGHGQVAVKVIDDRGNELLVVKSVTEAKG